jgi:hypothetical protein
MVGGIFNWCEQTIDTTKYTVLAFDVPGNGFDGFVIENYPILLQETLQNFVSGIQLLGLFNSNAIIAVVQWVAELLGKWSVYSQNTNN